MGRKMGAVPFGGSNTMSTPGPRPTSLPSGILMQPTFWPQQTWAENWLGAVVAVAMPYWGAGSACNTVWPGRAEVYLYTNWHLGPYSRLDKHNRHGPKTAAVPPFWRGSWVSI